MSETLDESFAHLSATALRIKAERDAMEATLRDIILGAEMMMQPHCATRAGD